MPYDYRLWMMHLAARDWFVSAAHLSPHERVLARRERERSITRAGKKLSARPQIVVTRRRRRVTGTIQSGSLWP